jgi:hypothetical protein
MRPNGSKAGATIALYALFAILAIYLPLNTRGSFQFTERQGWLNYDMLADALLAKQFHLKLEVDPRRLQAEDPRDPSHPSPYLVDAIIWDAKYYFQHEPLPGILHAFWKTVTGLPCRTGLLVVLSASGVLIILAMLLLKLRRRFFAGTPWWIFWYVWTSFSLSAVQLYIVSRPVIYNEAVAMGSLFSLAGVLCIVSALNPEVMPFTGEYQAGELTGCNPQATCSVPFSQEVFGNGLRRYGLCALAGCCFGAAVCSRASLIVYPVSLFACSVALRPLPSLQPREYARLCFVFIFPLTLFVLSLLAYNFLRFGNPFDFGRGSVIFPSHGQYLYVTLGDNFFRLQHVPYQLYHYLLLLPDFHDSFPFVRMPAVSFNFEQSGILVQRELVCSIFVLMPVLILILPTPFILRYGQLDGRLSFVMISLAVTAAAVLGLLTFVVRSAIRYIYDFAPLLFVLAYCNLSYLWDWMQRSFYRKMVTTAALVFLFAMTVLSGLLMGVKTSLHG